MCLSLLILLVTLLPGKALTSEVLTCEGFVAKRSARFMDYTNVAVHLFKDNLVKETIKVFPNGHFAVPVFDLTKNVVLRVVGPQGWEFTPREITVTKEVCSPGTDIFFEFAGLPLQGSVVFSGDCGGDPVQGVTLRLEPDATVVQTDQLGKFSFPALLPGIYYILAERSTTSVVNVFDTQVPLVSMLNFQSSTLEVKLSTTKTNEITFVATGQNISGVVAHYSGTFVKDITVTLTSKDGQEVTKATTNTAGIFTLENIPCSGEFTAMATAGLSLIAPKAQIVTVQKGEVSPLLPFLIEGIEMRGSIQTASGEPLAVQEVIMMFSSATEKFSAKTSADGMYSIALKPGEYQVTAEKQGYAFSTITVPVSTSTTSLPAVRLSKVEVCGQTLGISTENLGHFQIIISAKGNDAEQIVQVTEKGLFCLYLSPGTYEFTPKSGSTTVSPSKHRRSVGSAPFDDITFSQIVASVNGAVKCIEECIDVSIRVVRTDDPSVVAVTSLKGIGADEGEYSLRNLSPGTYKIQPIKASYCWNTPEVEVTIKETGGDFTAPKIVQTGFQVTLQATSDLPVTLVNKEHKVRVDVTIGDNLVCVPDRQTYIVEVPSCYILETPSLQITSTKEIVKFRLTVAELVVAGIVEVPSDHTEPLDIDVSAFRADGELSSLQKVPSTLQADGFRHYEFKVRPAQKLVLTPHSAALLFLPESQTIDVSTTCPSLEAFRSTSGENISGFINPPVAEVSVILQDADERLIVKSKSDSTGVFRLGPVHEGRKFKVLASRPGYEFKVTSGVDTDGFVIKNNSVQFQAKQLSAIVVIFKEDITQEPIEGVFVSVSGDNYRQSLLTSASGAAEFTNVPPGKYYLRTSHKEYKIQHNSPSVSVQEGKVTEEVLWATRTGFSCFGTVVSLTGTPLEGVDIEARADDQEESGAVSDSQGRFQIRGLQTGRTYHIRVQPGSVYDRTIPHSSQFTIEKNVEGVQLIAVPNFQTTTVMGIVHTDSRFTESLEVQLCSPNGALLAAAPVMLHKFFQFTNFKVNSFPASLVLKVVPRPSARTLIQTSSAEKTIEIAYSNEVVSVDLVFEGTLNELQSEMRQPSGSIVQRVILLAGLVTAYIFRDFLSNLVGSKNAGSPQKIFAMQPPRKRGKSSERKDE